MILLMCHEHDPSAPVIARGLTDRGVGPVEVISDHDLLATTVNHSVRGGMVRTELRLPNGAEVDDSQIGFLVNRLTFVHPSLIALDPEDATYVATEWQALLVSFLWSLGTRVLNRPDPFCLAGRMRSAEEWEARARAHGLTPGRPAGTSGAGHIAYVGEEVLSSADGGFTAALVEMARREGFRSAEIRLEPNGSDGRLRLFVHGNVDFTIAPARCIDGLASLIEEVAA